VLEAADTYPRETSGNLPLTDNVLYPINSGFVAVAAFKERTVDKKCAKANVPTTADATLKQRLSDMFIHNAATKDGDTYSSKVTLAGGKDIGYDLGDRYCQDRGRLPATATTKKIIAKQ
jgi:hypothetical protein